jgi:RHH-type rel operon transcriptional repressor/antitoxin RelB
MALSIQLPSDVENRLARLVQATGHDQAFYVIEALREHLDDIEDAYLAASIVEEVRAGRMRTYSIEETRRALGLDD